MKAKEARANWQRTFERVTELENSMIVLIPALEQYGYPNVVHMARIAKGNISTVKEILLYNQQRIETNLTKPSTGGKSK